MRAERVGNLVVLRAQRLPTRLWLELAALADDVGCTLWLVSHIPALSESRKAVLARFGEVRLLSWREGAAVLAEVDRTSSGVGLGAEVPPFPAVPDVDFPTFRAVARRMLSHAAFTRFDEVYRAAVVAARQEAQRWPRGKAADSGGAALLQRMSIGAADANEVVTRVRATQAEFFAQGRFVSLTLNIKAVESHRFPVAPRLPPHVVTRLRMLASPTTAALMTLVRASGLTDRDMLQLQCGEVHEALGEGLLAETVAGRLRIPAHAAAPMRALLEQRRASADTAGTGTEGFASSQLFGTISAARVAKLRASTAGWIGVDYGPGRLGFVRVVDIDPLFTDVELS